MQYRYTSVFLSLLSLLVLLLASCKEPSHPGEQKKITTPAKQVQTTKAPSTGLGYLKKFDGKYPHDVNLLTDSLLTRRLQALLKNRFEFFKSTWAVETPIEVRGNNFVASGCEQHNCGNTNFIIVVDLSKDIVYAGIREDGDVATYTEDGSNNPELVKWASDN